MAYLTALALAGMGLHRLLGLPDGPVSIVSYSQISRTSCCGARSATSSVVPIWISARIPFRLR